MKKRLNAVFFGICFLIALLSEAYYIVVRKDDLFTIIGIGLVVLITAYLFMDTIRGTVKQNIEVLKFYTDRLIREEDEKWKLRYSELENHQKAVQAEVRSIAELNEKQSKEFMDLLEAIEDNSQKHYERIIRIQKLSMEGQRNALNLEIQYNRANTKQLIKVLREYKAGGNYEEPISKILVTLEENNALLKKRFGSLDNSEDSIVEKDEAIYESEEIKPDSGVAETNMETEAARVIEQENKDNTPVINDTEVLKADPNKELSAEEIAALFATLGK